MGDEVNYVDQAARLLAGDWPPAVDLRSKYPYFWPALLAAFWGAVGEGAVFALGPLCWLGAAWLLRRDAVAWGLKRWWGWVLALTPALALYGRTAMTDVPAAALILAAVQAAERRRPLIVAAALVAAVWLRVAALVPALALVVAALWAWRRQPPPRRALVASSAVALLGAAVWMAHNTVVWGAPWALGYQPGEAEWVWRGSLGRLVFYGTSLALMPPLLLPLGLAAQWRRAPLRVAVVVAVLLAQSLYYYVDRVPSWWASQVVGQRLVLPAVLLLLAPWAAMLRRLVGRLAPQWDTAALLLGLVAAVLVGAQHGAVAAPHAAARALCARAAHKPLWMAPTAGRVAVFCREATARNVAWPGAIVPAGVLYLTTSRDPSLRSPSYVPPPLPNDCADPVTIGWYIACVPTRAWQVPDARGSVGP